MNIENKLEMWRKPNRGDLCQNLKEIIARNKMGTSLDEREDTMYTLG